MESFEQAHQTQVDLENIFVIGDVHGCYHTLMNLIKQFPKDAELIFVGDLCDKGDFSKEVIEFVIENNHKCVKGNHEHLFEKNILNALENNIHTPWSNDKRYGGFQCIKSYNGDIALIKKHLQWIRKLPIYIQIDKYFITHGFGLEYYKKRDEPESYSDFLFSRIYSETIEPKIDEEIVNIFGHCVFDEVKRGDKYICLDTGCSNGGKLSAIELGCNKLFQESMDTRDSSYIVKELKLKDIDLREFTLDHIRDITLGKSCVYNSFDVVSNEVLEYILTTYPKEAKQEISLMRKRSVIFPKQFHKIFNKSTLKDQG